MTLCFRKYPAFLADGSRLASVLLSPVFKLILQKIRHFVKFLESPLCFALPHVSACFQTSSHLHHNRFQCFVSCGNDPMKSRTCRVCDHVYPRPNVTMFIVPMLCPTLTKLPEGRIRTVAAPPLVDMYASSRREVKMQMTSTGNSHSTRH